MLKSKVFDLGKIYVLNLKTGRPKKMQLEIFLKSRVYCSTVAWLGTKSPTLHDFLVEKADV